MLEMCIYMYVGLHTKCPLFLTSPPFEWIDQF